MKAKLAKEEAEKVAAALENAQPEPTTTEESPATENVQPEATTTAESPAKALTEARSSEKKEEDYVKHAECCVIS